MSAESTTRSHCLIRAGLVLVVCAALLLPVLFTALEAAHDCNDHAACPVCTVIVTCVNLSTQPGAVPSAVGVGVVVVCFGITKIKRLNRLLHPIDTPISLKVRLTV